MTIYLDVIFLENFFMNYIILFAVGYITKAKLKQTLLIISSILGSGYATFVYMQDTYFYSNIIIKIVLSSLIFKLSAALLEPITDKRITSSIAAAGESLILIMSCVLCVSLMFFVLIAIMISAGKFVVGG